MKLIIQPGDGVDRLVKGIRKAKKSVEIMIFRLDRDEIERALIDAVERGLFVHALIAFTNRGGEDKLRKLEMRFLASGVTVARTAGDLVRYHGKMMIVDRKELYVLGFNFTHLDIDRSRSFGIITRNPKLVAEAVRLFETDTKRQEYSPSHHNFVVSPANARRELARFIKGAEKELLIYDLNISDKPMLRLLEERRRLGVDIRVLGSVSGNRLPSYELKRMRLHTRTIIRDRSQAFIGSQSLRQLELDARREIGVIFRDATILKDLCRVFEEDWINSAPEEEPEKHDEAPPKKAVKKLARKVVKRIALAPVAKKVTKIISKKANGNLDKKQIHETVMELVEDVVKEAAQQGAVEGAKTVS
jgi:phosphatidylserine/phosphatidylglycerophosphate/cardiolipin synthase-like enzyme